MNKISLEGEEEEKRGGEAHPLRQLFDHNIITYEEIQEVRSDNIQIIHKNM